MRTAIVVGLVGLVISMGIRPLLAQNPAEPQRRLDLVDIKGQHPKAYRPQVGDGFQCFLQFPVVPDKIVDDLEFKIEGE